MINKWMDGKVSVVTWSSRDRLGYYRRKAADTKNTYPDAANWRYWKRRTGNGLLWEAIGASERPFSPQGFGQHTEAMSGPHLGKRIPFESLPVDVQTFIEE